MGHLVGVLVQPLGGESPLNIAQPAFDAVEGSDIAMFRNTDSGKYDLQWDATGNVIFDNSRSHAVLSVLYETKGQYWADTTGQRGSYLSLVKEDRVSAPSKLVGYAQDALQFLVDGHTITAPKGQAAPIVGATRVRPGRIDLSITYSTPQTQNMTFTLKPTIPY